MYTKGTDCPDMTLAVDWHVKLQSKQTELTVALKIENARA